MLRETRARMLALATAVVVIALAALFALLRNPDGGAPVPRAVATDPRFEVGRRAFDRLGCAGCHSIEGRGNPDSPLDRIGARLDRDSIRDWAIGAGAARDELPASIARRKARVGDDPDLPALLDWLAASR